MIYYACKKLIEGGNYNYDDMMNKLDIFLLGNRITPEQYAELTGMVATQHPDKQI